MSKFLKVIVNLFLVCAILIAGALLVPPLVGISTTMVDSSYMASNLPIGSVTYSQKVSMTEISENDKILIETDSEIRAYTVESVDAGEGHCIVTDAKNSQAESEELTLRSVSKILITIPMIGYVMIAMRSLEGIIIIGLVVLFIIILFILSELWKKTDDEEDEEDEEDTQEAEEEWVASDAKVEADAYPEPITELSMEELARSVAEVQGEEKEVEIEQENKEEESDAEHAAKEVEDALTERALELPEVEEREDNDRNSFVPVTRPTKEEILKKAEAAGEEPEVIEYESIGVTIIDYSDLL